jgi:hypothetical protein
MRRFVLRRHTDVSGVSGTGVVAEGVVFTDGTTAVRWLSSRSSTVIWSSIEDVRAVHGHAGATEIVWWDQDGTEGRPVDGTARA